MKVLMISKACYVAVYRRKLECLASYPDVELTLLVPPYWRSGSRKDMYERGYDKGYRTIIRRPAFDGNFHLHFYPGIKNIISEVDPDIIHIDEEPYDLVTFLSLRSGLRHGAKTLFFTWQNIGREFPIPFRWFERSVLSRSDAAIAGNQEAIDILRNKGFSKPVHLIPQFGVDTEFFRPSPDKIRGTPFRIGFAGRLVWEKGLYVLFDALAGIDGRWELVIIGDGPIRNDLARYAEKLEIQDKISWIGPVPSTKMPEYISKLDLLVLPSLTKTNWKEQFGRVLVEAMACGVPVIGSDSGEIPNVIDDTGIICPEGDAPALRRAIDGIMHDSSLWKRLSTESRCRAEDVYSQEVIARRTYEAYKELAHGETESLNK